MLLFYCGSIAGQCPLTSLLQSPKSLSAPAFRPLRPLRPLGLLDVHRCRNDRLRPPCSESSLAALQSIMLFRLGQNLGIHDLRYHSSVNFLFLCPSSDIWGGKILVFLFLTAQVAFALPRTFGASGAQSHNAILSILVQTKKSPAQTGTHSSFFQEKLPSFNNAKSLCMHA